RFYETATTTLIAHDGLIDKLIGDEVMALFLPGLSGPDYRRNTARSAIELARAVSDLSVGVAAHAGVAFVGNVGSGTVTDFTALGDAVNVGARLQESAGPGEVVLSRELYELVADEYPGARVDRTDVRGRDEPIETATISL